MAHVMSQPSAAVDMEINGRQQPRRYRQVYKPGTLGNPRTIQFSSSYPAAL
jgi:hypothetical protein